MFTGIVECLGTVREVTNRQDNVNFKVASPISSALKVDQSVSHNGVCLTVTDCDAHYHVVTAIHETLSKSNLATWKVGSVINLERAMVFDGRLDGHIVQGHVDTTGICEEIIDQNGSWIYRFSFIEEANTLLVNKGSICVNGVSLTVVSSGFNWFTVAIIPYTYTHTNFHLLMVGDTVNLEFDIIGKYISKYLITK